MAWSNPVELAEQIGKDVVHLNLLVSESKETITLQDARRLDSKVREIERWLLGIRRVLLSTTPPPGADTP